MTHGSAGADRKPNPAVLLRSLPPVDFRYKESYLELAALAERGDATAAYKLWLGLRACSGAPNTTYYIDKVLPFRRTVPGDPRKLSFEWLTRAAAAGLVRAQLDVVIAAYLSVGPPPEELGSLGRQVLQALEEVALAGNPVALSHLWRLYSHSMVYSPGRECEIPRDDLKAYAYITASREILGIISSGEDMGLGHRVPAGQLQEAERLRADIVRAAHESGIAG